MSKAIQTFLTLVTINSPSGQEKEISTFLQKWLKKNKFSYKVDSVGNIYAANDKPGQPLLLCAHMDTVQPGVDIKPIIKNGVIKSSGNTILGADNKAALAAILTAIETEKPDKAIELLFTVKEETGGGVEFFPFKWIKAKKGIIFDKSNPPGGIVLNSPYICNFHAIITGKAAHASIPQNGINAFVPAFKALSQIPAGVLDNGQTTINVGAINGGTGMNVVPEKIQVSGEVRSYDKKLFQSRQENIQKLLKRESKKHHTKCDFSKDGYCAGYSFSKSDPFVKQIEKLYSEMGLKTEYFERSGISDANILNKAGVKTVNVTDGVRFPHTKEEQITVKDLELLPDIIIACIKKL